MSQNQKSNPVVFTESSLNWLMQATEPDPVDPRIATQGQLIHNAVLLKLRKDIQTMAERNGTIR